VIMENLCMSYGQFKLLICKHFFQDDSGS